MKTKDKAKEPEKRYPTVANPEVNNPEVPLHGSPCFLWLCNELLTPEEIKAAVEKGKELYQASVERTKNRHYLMLGGRRIYSSRFKKNSILLLMMSRLVRSLTVIARNNRVIRAISKKVHRRGGSKSQGEVREHP